MQPLPDLSTLSLGLAAHAHLVPGLNGFCRQAATDRVRVALAAAPEPGL